MRLQSLSRQHPVSSARVCVSLLPGAPAERVPRVPRVSLVFLLYISRVVWRGGSPPRIPLPRCVRRVASAPSVFLRPVCARACVPPVFVALSCSMALNTLKRRREGPDDSDDPAVVPQNGHPVTPAPAGPAPPPSPRDGDESDEKEGDEEAAPGQPVEPADESQPPPPPPPAPPAAVWYGLDKSRLGGLWGLSREEMAAALGRVEVEWCEEELAAFIRDQVHGLLLLTAKNATEHLAARRRKQALEDCLSGALPGADPVDAEKWDRLRHLVIYEQDRRAGAHQTWGEFLDRPDMRDAWGPGQGSTVFFENVVPESLVQRVQETGLCYMHAPNVVAHYHIWQSKRNAALAANVPLAAANHEMLDLTAFMLKWVSGEDLWQFVVKPEGRAGPFLARLLAIRVDIVRTMDTASLREPGAAEEIIGAFDAHGPLLISYFVINNTWRDAGIHSHLARDDDNTDPGGHSMAIVGYRRDAEGARFLVQNWWPDKQFFECSVEYLVSRQAQLAWVTVPVYDWPAVYESVVINAEFAVNAIDGPAVGDGPAVYTPGFV